MSLSVVIVAHNEEKNIERCIKSLLNQTMKADEIILVAHNCDDRTVEIASKFPITIMPLIGTPGISHSRHFGITQASGTKILCIDGDAYASLNWIESLDQLLNKTELMLVGSYVVYTGSLFWFLARPINYIFSKFQKNKIYWLLGPGFGFTKPLKNLVLESLSKFPALKNNLNLNYHPDDFWIALKSSQLCTVMITHKSTIWATSKDGNFLKAFKRICWSYKNINVLNNYLLNQNKK